MKYSEITTPIDLMTFLDENFEYGVIDNQGNKLSDSNSEEFQKTCCNQWKLRTVEQMIVDQIGHCYDQVEIERDWFERHNYEILTFWICAYQEEIENSGFSHTYLLYKEGSSWKLFEHSDFFTKGIYSFNSIQEAVLWQANRHIKFAESCIRFSSLSTQSLQRPPKDHFLF